MEEKEGNGESVLNQDHCSPANCDIFDFIAHDVGLTVIHPGGLAATAALADALQINTNTTVIDIGCGKGTTAVFLAEKYGCKVTAIDISEELIESGQSLAEKKGLSDRITFFVGDATNIPFPDNHFDVALSQAVLVFFGDKAPAIREADRVIKKGGRAGWLELSWKTRKTGRMSDIISNELRSHCMEKAESFEGWRKVFGNAGIRDLTVIEQPFSMSFDVKNMMVMLKDEGIENSLQIIRKYLTRRDVRHRMNAISRIFSEHADFFGCGIYVFEKTDL
jgi:ubiquinone/menaquinone biosynthesis C-methylase UbiE